VQNKYRSNKITVDCQQGPTLTTSLTTTKTPEITAADATSPSNTPVTTSELEHPQYPSFGTVVFAFGGIAVLAAVFVGLGGVRYVRRMVSGGKDAQYRRLDGEGGVAHRLA